MTVVRIGERAPSRRRSLLLRRVTPATVLALIAAIAGLRLWVVETAIVEGRSMDDALLPGDRVLVGKLLSIRRFDIVVLEEPETGSIAIKRVVGLPRETVSMVPHTEVSGGREFIYGSQVYVNGEPADEPYATSLTPGSMPPVRIPENAYFVLGDNRDASIDSRRYGPVDEDAIRGVGVAVVYPPSRMGIIDRVAGPVGPATAETSY
jgi:signal peptidase I